MDIQKKSSVIESEHQWLNEKEAAKMLSLSVYTLRQHRHKGVGFPYVKYGKSVRYSLDDIAEFMNSHKIKFL